MNANLVYFCFALALVSNCEAIAIGAERRLEQPPRKTTIFRVSQAFKDGRTIAQYEVAITADEMSLSTRLIDAAAGSQLASRDDDYINIYWKNGLAMEWAPGAVAGITYRCDGAQMTRYLLSWINRGGLYSYALRYFPPGQPDGTYLLNLPDSDPLKDDFPNVKVTVVAGKAWISEATIFNRKLPDQPIVIERALPDMIENFEIPSPPAMIRFAPGENPLGKRMQYRG